MSNRNIRSLALFAALAAGTFSGAATAAPQSAASCEAQRCSTAQSTTSELLFTADLPGVDKRDELRRKLRELRRRARAGDPEAIEKLEKLRDRLRERRGERGGEERGERRRERRGERRKDQDRPQRPFVRGAR